MCGKIPNGGASPVSQKWKLTSLGVKVVRWIVPRLDIRKKPLHCNVRTFKLVCNYLRIDKRN